jgi:hypothetical protein
LSLSSEDKTIRRASDDIDGGGAGVVSVEKQWSDSVPILPRYIVRRCAMDHILFCFSFLSLLYFFFFFFFSPSSSLSFAPISQSHDLV